MFRRLTTSARTPAIAAALVALTALSAGCTTFSDNDAVARVNDVEFTQDDFEAQLTELGATPDDPLSGDALRGEITTWIQAQLADLPVDEDALRAVYEAGAPTSGMLCLSGIVVADEQTATEVLADLDGGTPFDDAFAESNLDPQIAATGGALPCSPSSVELNAGVPFLEAAVELTPDEMFTAAPLVDPAGDEVAWVVLQFRPFDELAAEDLAILNTSQADGADVYVAPRYGTFDSASSQVVPLG